MKVIPANGKIAKARRRRSCGLVVLWQAVPVEDLQGRRTREINLVASLTRWCRNHRQGHPVTYRECYISLAQNKARATRSIRISLVAEGCATGTGKTLAQLVNTMQPLFCQTGIFTIHASSAKETIFSFTDDEDAHLTYSVLTACEDTVVAGAILKFRQWMPTDELGFDVAEQRISVSIAGLILKSILYYLFLIRCKQNICRHWY